MLFPLQAGGADQIAPFARLVVDEFVGQQEVVVKSFDAAKGMPQMFNGATILTNGSPALILDAQGIA